MRQPSIVDLEYQNFKPWHPRCVLITVYEYKEWYQVVKHNYIYLATRVGTLIVATIYLQLIQNRYMFRSFTVLQCSHQRCLQPFASDVEVVGYL